MWRGLQMGASQHWPHSVKCLKRPVPRLHPRIFESKALKNMSIGSKKGKKKIPQMNLMKSKCENHWARGTSPVCGQQSWDRCLLARSFMLPQEAVEMEAGERTRRGERRGRNRSRKEGQTGRFTKLDWKEPRNKEACCSLS